MMSHHVYYQLAILGFLWLCIMLHCGWPSRSTRSPLRPAEPVPHTCKRTCSTEPKPFLGLTHKPHCEACEQAVASRREPPSAPPPPLVPTRGRRHHVDTSHHFCPDPACRYGGWQGLGNMSSNGQPSGGSWRQLYCSRCQGYFLDRTGISILRLA
jgi:hypothetical protein